MGKFCGTIGFATYEETTNDDYIETIKERTYIGEIDKNVRNIQDTSEKHNNPVINNTFSIIADDYAHENFLFMRYIIYNNIKLEVKSVDIDYPRIIITAGGIYNG